jgi:arylsulfatase A-like enzyme
MTTRIRIIPKKLLIFMFVMIPLTGLAQEQKNVLLLMADDFNHWTRAIGYYEQSHTPNIDKLAGMGVLFTEAHCASPVCNPSRNAFLSGYRPTTTGISANSHGFVREKAGFEDIITLHQYFKQEGYFVYGAGKIWHPGRMNYSKPECDPGNWTQLNTNPSGCRGGTYAHFEATSENFTEFVWGGNPDPMSESNCNDLGLANDVAELIGGYSTSARADQPFFIACGFFRPHLPWNSPKQFWDLYHEDSLSIPKGYKEGDLADIEGAGSSAIFDELVRKEKWIEGIHAYLASLSLADHNVGVVMEALESSGYLKNTVVVFMGDHGWHLGEKDRWSKYAVYDQANHTTMIIYDPSAKGNGNVCQKVVSMQDIYPTLIELSGVTPRTDLEGRSLAPLLEDPARLDWNYPIMMTYAGTNIIKTNQYRFVDNGSRSQLYEVSKDPYEWENLYGISGSEPIVTYLKSEMDSMIRIGSLLRQKLLSNYHYFPVFHRIPGLIEAENYDEGVESQTFHDTDSINEGGHYRLDGVDIAITDDPLGGAFHITSTEQGEWLTYSVTDYENGTYEIASRIRSDGSGDATLRFYLNNRELTELSISATDTEWSDFTITDVLIDELHTLRLRIEIEGNGVDINSFRFTRVDNVGGVFEIRDDGSRAILDTNRIDNHTLHLDLTSMNPMVRLQIYALDGEQVEENLIPGELHLAYSIKEKLDHGLYILRVSDGENDRSERFLIE